VRAVRIEPFNGENRDPYPHTIGKRLTKSREPIIRRRERRRTLITVPRENESKVMLLHLGRLRATLKGVREWGVLATKSSLTLAEDSETAEVTGERWVSGASLVSEKGLRKRCRGGRPRKTHCTSVLDQRSGCFEVRGQG